MCAILMQRKVHLKVLLQKLEKLNVIRSELFLPSKLVRHIKPFTHAGLTVEASPICACRLHFFCCPSFVGRLARNQTSLSRRSVSSSRVCVFLNSEESRSDIWNNMGMVLRRLQISFDPQGRYAGNLEAHICTVHGLDEGIPFPRTPLLYPKCSTANPQALCKTF